MRLSDVDMAAVRQALAEMPGRFRTKDLCHHPHMEAAHRAYLQERSYHANVGRVVSRSRDELRLRLVDYRADLDGALWERVND